MQKFILAAIAAGAVASLAGPASAETFSKMRISQLQSVLQAGGVSVSTTSRSDVLRAGATFLYLTDCDSAGLCGEINLFRNYNDVFPTLEAVNNWNSTKKIPEASINGNGTLHMEMWLSTIGATDTIILDTLGWFDRYAGDAEFWGPYIKRSGV